MRDDFAIKSDIIDSLEKVMDPQAGKDIVSLGMIHKIEVQDGAVKVTVTFGDDRPQNERFVIEDNIYEIVEAIDGVKDTGILAKSKSGPKAPTSAPPKKGMRLHGDGASEPSETSEPSARVKQDPAAGGGGPSKQQSIDGVAYVIAVASGKGGVGKSTVAINLALALDKLGYSTGLLDIDIYGPSLPTLLNIQERPAVKDRRIVPLKKANLQLMSLGFLMEEDTPVIWRGPIVTGIIRQFLQDVDWRGLDYLIVDLPPGTGDAQLSLAQNVPVDGAIIVTTPSDLALVDAARGLQMFRTLNVDVLGIVENMSYYTWPAVDEAQALVSKIRSEAGDAASESIDALEKLIADNSKKYIFGKGGGRREAERMEIKFLGEIPLDGKVRSGGDEGNPIMLQDPEGKIAESFLSLARGLAESCPITPKGEQTEKKKGVFSFLKS